MENTMKIRKQAKIMNTMAKGGRIVSAKNQGGAGAGIGYTLGKLGTGALGVLEGIWDYGAGGIAKLFGADEWAEKQFAENVTGDLNEELDNWYNPSKGWQVAGEVAGGVGNSLVGVATVAGASVISGGTLSAPVAALISGGTIGLGSAGMATTEAYEKTGQLGAKEFGYGALSGVTEAGIEALTGAAGKVGAKVFAKKTAKDIAKKSVLKGLVGNFAGEAFEEGLSTFLSPYYQRWTQVDPNAENATYEEIGHAALIGGLSGALLGGMGNATNTVKSISRGNTISKNASQTNAIVKMARDFAEYETQHNTGKYAYQHIKQLVDKYNALDNGSGNYTLNQKKLLGEMEEADVILTLEPMIQRSKERIVANADEFIKAINDRKMIDDTTGKVIHFDNVNQLTGNELMLTQFAVSDALGQLMLSKDSVYDLIASKGRTDGIMQADFRKFQKEATKGEKESVNSLFGIDVDSITYEDFIDKIQKTDKSVFDGKKTELQIRAKSKTAISKAINTKEKINGYSQKTKLADGINLFKTNKGKVIAVSKIGDGYYLYLDGNISTKLTKAKLTSAINELNGKVEKKKENTAKETAQNVQKTTKTAKTKKVSKNIETKQKTENTDNQPIVTETTAETQNNSVETVNMEKTQETEIRTDAHKENDKNEESTIPETKGEISNVQTEETETKSKPETKQTEKKATKAPTKVTARRGVIRLVMSKSNRESLRGAVVKDGKQYVSDGFFVARYNDVLEGVTEVPAEGYPFEVFDRVIGENADATAEERIKLDGDKIREFVPTKRADYVQNIMRIGKNFYQLPYVSKIIDSIVNPQIFLKKKGNFNPIYIKGDNGEAVLLPLRLENGNAKPVYEADYVNYTDADKAKARKEKTIQGKTYKDFTVEEFKELIAPLQSYYLVKDKKPNAIVFARLGDFYEAFFNDAQTVAKEFDLTLTSRKVKGYSERVEMVGFPITKIDEYTVKLNEKGVEVVRVDLDGKEVVYEAENNKTNTEKPKTTVKKTEDFGEKIGGARKDEWRKRGLRAYDIADMNSRELEKHVKKENVWKRPNWVQAIANGGDRGLLYAQNEIYKSLNTTPYMRGRYSATDAQIQENAKLYAEEIAEIQAMAEKAKTAADFAKMGNSWLAEKGYIEVHTNNIRNGSTYTDKYYSSPALYGSAYINTLNHLIKRFDGLSETALMEGFGVAMEDKLPRGYEIRKTANSYYGSTYEIGNYYIVKGRYIVARGFNTLEDAIKYGKEKFGTAATSNTAKKGKEHYIPPQLTDVHRSGLDYRAGKGAKGDDFLADFGIKGGEFGNWLSESDRTESLNYAYDAFCDLADAVGIKMTDISLNGTLSIGFGSRGQGLSGAVAHYEPDRKVINLTKMKGAGSLAHEWWHAFEDYISGDTHQSQMTSDFSKLTEKTRKAAFNLVNTINYREATVEEKQLERQKRHERNVRQLDAFLRNYFSAFDNSQTAEQRQEKAKLYHYKRAVTDADVAKFEELKATAQKGVANVYSKFISEEKTIVDEFSALIKDITGRGLFKEERKTLAYYIDAMDKNSDIVLQKHTKFYDDAVAISVTYAKDGGYWDSNCEMLARAFAAYITDKTSGNNDYLSGHSEGSVPTEKGTAYIMPIGEERKRINKAFDELFKAAKEDGLISSATHIKPTTTVKYAVTETADLNSQPAGNKSQNLTPLQMKRAENVARNNIKGYENLTAAEKLEVEWTLASAWRAGKSTTEALNLARLSTAISAGVGFADFSTKTTDGRIVTPDAACYTRGGHLTIYLNPNGKRPIETATLHELTHSLEGMEGYAELQAMAEKYYAEHPAEKKAIDDTYREVYKNEQVRYAEEILPSELTAHYVETMLAKRDMLAKLTQEKPTFVQKCIEKIKAIHKKLTKADRNANMSEVDMLETRFTTIFNLNKGKIPKNSNLSGVKLSIKKINGKDTVVVDTDQHIFDGVQREELGNVARKYIQERFRGKTIDGTTYSRISEKEYTHSKDTQRLFNQSGSEYSAKMRASTELINLVKTGELIGHESAKHTKPVNAGGFNRYNVYFILDGKTFKGELLIAQGSNNVATFYDIVKIKESNSTSNNTQVAGRSNALSDNSISKNNEKVNKKYALSSKMDSEGRVLSAEQQKYFADSKVTDNDGNLLVVYHGTNNDFYTFDSGRVGKGIDQFGSGYYFTTNKDHAGAYGNRTIEGYLNLKNPFIIEVGDNGGTIDQFYRQPVTQSQAEKILKMHPDIYSTEDSPLGNYSERYWTEGATESVIKEVAAQMDEIGMFTDNTMFGYYPNELNAAIKKVLGYDGIQVNYGKYEKYYIAWEQNQIKDVTNTSPTTAADIRYALSEEQQAKLDSTKGADKVMTELPNDKVSVKDVLTKEKSVSELAGHFKGNSRQYAEGFKIAMTNAQAGLERVMKESGIKDATALSNYVRAGKYAAFNALDYNGAQYSLDGETYLGESWGKIWKPIYEWNKKDGEAYAKFQEYLLHWHNIDRMAVGKPVFGKNVSAEDSMEAIREIEETYPKFNDIAKKVWKYLDNNLQLSVDSGMYTQEYADNLRTMYPHYVPTLREEHINGVAPLQGKRNVAINANKKRAKGGEERILPIDETVAQQTVQKYSAARTNALLVKIVESRGHEEFKIMESEEAEIDIDTDTLVSTYEDKAKNTYQITFYHNGKRVTAQVSRNLFKGVEAFSGNGDSEFNNAILNGMAKINSTFKKLVTSWNPFFSFFRNPIRDIQDAGLYTRYPLKVFTRNYMRARKEIANNGKYWQEAKAAGIAASSVYDYEKGLTYKNESKAKQLLARIDGASNAIEMAPRMAEYISAREAGLSVQEALLQAQDITTNFGRSGIFAKKLNATVMPFLNPAIQGFSKMVRAYTGKDAAQSWKNLIIRSIILGIGMTALNDLLNEDDEEYEDLSDYVKENNYVLSLGDGNYLKIPKGRVVSVFGGAFLRSKQYMSGDKKAFDGYLNSIASAVTPVDNFTRFIFSPITDVKTNTTWYGGEIESAKWDNTKPKDRYDETTSNIAIWLGNVFDYSPIKIDYLLEQYGGVVSDIVLPATTLQAEKGIISQNFLSNSVTNSKWTSEFYDTLEEYNYEKTAGSVTAKGIVKYLNSVKGTISDIYAQKREIQANKELSDEEKLTQSKILQATINALAKEAITNAKYLSEELNKYQITDDNFEDVYREATSTIIGEEYALRSYNKQVYEKAEKMKKCGIGIGTYYDYYFDIKDISDTVKNAPLSGSKKSKIIEYTLKLDVPDIQKLILIMSNGYTITDNDIKGLSAVMAKKYVAEYIARLKITKSEKAELAKMCGLTVNDGKIVIKKEFSGTNLS